MVLFLIFYFLLSSQRKKNIHHISDFSARRGWEIVWFWNSGHSFRKVSVLPVKSGHLSGEKSKHPEVKITDFIIHNPWSGWLFAQKFSVQLASYSIGMLQWATYSISPDSVFNSPWVNSTYMNPKASTGHDFVGVHSLVIPDRCRTTTISSQKMSECYFSRLSRFM